MTPHSLINGNRRSHSSKNMTEISYQLKTPQLLPTQMLYSLQCKTIVVQFVSGFSCTVVRWERLLEMVG